MIVLLLLLFNWYLLYGLLDWIFGFMGTPSLHEEIICAVVALGVVLGLTLLFNSNVGQWLLRLTSGARKPILRELQQIMPVVDRVQHAVKEKINLNPLSLHLMIVDDPMPNALALGKNTLIVTRGLYESANEEELAGVIAHEVGHLQHGDSHKLGIAMGVSVVSLSLAFIANIVISITHVTGKVGAAGKDGGLVLTFFSLFFNLLGFFMLLFVMLGNGVFRLALLYQGRKQEHKADAFAVKAGFGQGLLAHFEKMKDMQWEGKRSLIRQLYETHPATMVRIGEIEKILNSLEPKVLS